MINAIQEMQDYYGKRAAIYDASMGYNKPETVRALDPVIGKLRELLADRKVLEIACGPCFWTQQVCSATRCMMSTDFNESTLAEARKKQLDWDRVSLQIADAYDLPAFSETYNACLAVDWFVHVPQERFREFLDGLHSALSDQARIVFCDQLPRPGCVTGNYDQGGNHIQERGLPDGSTFQVIKHYFSDEEYRAIFSHYTNELEIYRFEECSRLIVSYGLGGQ